MGTCALAPREKKKLGRDVGRELAAKFGRKPYYSRLEVKRVMRRLDLSTAWDCWAFSLFLSQADFDAHHAATGEVCDYAAMRHAMATATFGNVATDFDMDHSWLDWPAFDFGGLFDALDVS
jgi:hypothetical protein